MTASSTGRRLGVALAAAATLTLAACGSSGGNHPNDLSSFVGTGTGTATVTGTPTSTLGAPSAPGRTSGHSSSNPVGSHSSTSANGGGGGSGGGGGKSSSSGGGGGGSHSSAPTQHCVSSDPSLPGASITVCPATGLHDGQTVTITGHGFRSNGINGRNLVYTECKYLGENANSYGASDCSINTSDLGASSTTSNSNGDVGPIQFTVHIKFKAIDCSTGLGCLVSVAPPVLANSDQQPHVLIKFG